MNQSCPLESWILIEFECTSFSASCFCILHEIAVLLLMLQAYHSVHIGNECTHLDHTPNYWMTFDFLSAQSSYSLEAGDIGMVLCKGTDDYDL